MMAKVQVFPDEAGVGVGRESREEIRDYSGAELQQQLEESAWSWGELEQRQHGPGLSRAFLSPPLTPSL